MVTLETLGVRIHSDIRYASGPVECDGELQVLDSDGNCATVRCLKCWAVTMVKVPGDMSWQKRKDLA